MRRRITQTGDGRLPRRAEPAQADRLVVAERIAEWSPYTLDAVGNRNSVSELNNRAVNWTYDGVYRLSNETITLDPNNKNGSVGYGLDPVGNRQTVNSTIPGLSPV